MLLDATIAVMSIFPEQLERIYQTVPKEYVNWAPDSWEGIPSETFTAIEQICHVRDIEIDGYQARLYRMLTEPNPFLESIDSYALARRRNYAATEPAEALASFKAARNRTLGILEDLTETHLKLSGMFEGYGQITVTALIHYLCSHDQQHLSGMQWLLGKIDSHRASL